MFCYCSFRFNLTMSCTDSGIFFAWNRTTSLDQTVIKFQFFPCFSFLFMALHFSQASIDFRKNCNIGKILFSTTVMAILDGEKIRFLSRGIQLQLRKCLLLTHLPFYINYSVQFKISSLVS